MATRRLLTMSKAQQMFKVQPMVATKVQPKPMINGTDKYLMPKLLSQRLFSTNVEDPTDKYIMPKLLSQRLFSTNVEGPTDKLMPKLLSQRPFSTNAERPTVFQQIKEMFFKLMRDFWLWLNKINERIFQSIRKSCLIAFEFNWKAGTSEFMMYSSYIMSLYSVKASSDSSDQNIRHHKIALGKMKALERRGKKHYGALMKKFEEQDKELKSLKVAACCVEAEKALMLHISELKKVEQNLLQVVAMAHSVKPLTRERIIWPSLPPKA